MNSSTVWNELNNCNVYNATKLLIIAELLTTTTTTPTTETDCQLSNILSFFNNKNKSILNDYNNISRSVHKQLVSIKFLKETIVQDIYLLLQSDWKHIYDTTSTTATTTIATASTTTGNSTNEIINKAKTLTSLSFINMYHNNSATTVGMQGLLRIYLDTAEGFIVNLLETELNRDYNTHTGKENMYFIIVYMLYMYYSIDYFIYLFSFIPL